MKLGRRVAIIGGVRTPFVKAGTVFKKLSFQELGAVAVKGLIDKYNIPKDRIGKLSFGSVMLDPQTPNWAREVAYKADLPKNIYSQSVSNNCISGLVAVTDIVESIAVGRIDNGIAGGSESLSNPQLLFKEKARQRFLNLSRARSFGEKLSLIAGFRPRDFLPSIPSVKEPSTGLTMGEHMEISAKQFAISRESQDEFALRSHLNAHHANLDGRLNQEIVPVGEIKVDQIIRSDTTLEKLAKLRPVFDKSSKGTITAGNSSPLTDGASAVYLMADDVAKVEGVETLATILDYEYAAIDANDGLLMAPAVAVPRLLKRNGLKLHDFDIIEIHEAFSAQVLANIKAWEDGWREDSIGKIDLSKVNKLGGSISIGHPFAATGGRILTTIANEMKRKDYHLGLISICAAGAMACAMIIVRDKK